MKITESEYLGIFGLSWQEKLADSTHKKVNSVDKNIAKKLKDFFQSGGLNVRMIENLHREYTALMASGYKPSNYNDSSSLQDTENLSKILSDKTKIEKVITDSFLRSLYDLSATGKIPFEKWNPAGYKESIILQKKFDTEKNIFEKISTDAKSVKNVLLFSGILAGLYYLNNVGIFNGKKN